jgi:hypothetical protein
MKVFAIQNTSSGVSLSCVASIDHQLSMEVMSFPSLLLFFFMDLTQLDHILERLASRYKLDAQEVLDKWLESRQVRDPEGWKLLDGIPCIIGGLTALLGKCHSHHSIEQLSILQGP